ncbi:MAG: PIN domain-containing protein, partial [Candidatus Cloacimonadaceae bacterium]|nr:PIN domain-containing protein [Candidatus Cloacimonadaceae bacterium]
MAKTTTTKSKKPKENKQKKIFVLDTNVLIHNPLSLFSFAEHRVVIPIVVIEEIDQFKKGVDEKSRNARQIGRYLDTLRKQGSLRDGVKTQQGGYIQVTVNNEITDSASKLFFLDRNDNLIIGTALYMQETYPDQLVTLVSKDANVRIKADCIGIKAENYESDTIKFDEYYTGWAEFEIDRKQYEQLKTNKYIPNKVGELFPHQFVRLSHKEAPEQILTTRYNADHNMLYLLQNYTG